MRGNQPAFLEFIRDNACGGRASSRGEEGDGARVGAASVGEARDRRIRRGSLPLTKRLYTTSAAIHQTSLTMSLERIIIDPAICHGKPCVRGLRYPVETILELLSSGMTPQEILADYEDLEYEDILAVLAYAARLSQIKRVQAVAA